MRGGVERGLEVSRGEDHEADDDGGGDERLDDDAAQRQVVEHLERGQALAQAGALLGLQGPGLHQVDQRHRGGEAEGGHADERQADVDPQDPRAQGGVGERRRGARDEQRQDRQQGGERADEAAQRGDGVLAQQQQVKRAKTFASSEGHSS